MARTPRVLILEDLPRWRDELSEALTDTQFEVHTASTPAEALDLYQDELFHILMLDIRMEDADPLNTEGMAVLRELSEASRGRALGIVMCTGYPMDEHQRESFKHHGVSDYLVKGRFSDAELAQSIADALTERVPINLDLAIHWQRNLDPEQAVRGLMVGGERVKAGSPRAELLARELEDLLCRLFFKAESLLVEPLTPGRSGTGVVLAQPFMPSGAGQPVVVKYGDVGQVDLEYRRFEEYVRPFVRGGRATHVLDLRRTPRLGGLVYSFLGTAAEGRLRDFAEFYRESEPAEIRATLNELFLETCSAWYQSLGSPHPIDLSEHYREHLGIESERLEMALSQHLKSVQGKEKLFFGGLEERPDLPNPILRLEKERRVLPTYECLTHGDLIPCNVLLDDEGHAWLIDFQKTSVGHLLRDLIQLDCAVRFELVPEEIGLPARLELEQALHGMSKFPKAGDTVPPVGGGPEVEKALDCSVHIRRLAGRFLERHPGARLDEFHLGALYVALNYLRFLSLPTIVREHALLSASLISRHLER